MKLFYGDYCTSSQITIDDVDVTRLIEEDRLSEAIPIVKEAVIKYVEECYDLSQLTDIFTEIMINNGEYNDLGECEQCGHYNEEYKLKV